MGRTKKQSKRISISASEQENMLHKNLSFSAAEQYKMLRTNLSFSLHEEQKCCIVGVVSPMRGEGKSTTSINLSYSLAETDKKVLLIDADLRLPSVAKKMGMDSVPGLSNLLFDFDKLNIEDFKSEHCDNWYIIPSGDVPPNPSELLGSTRMEQLLDKLSESFDYIIVDLPPVNIVSDALVISKLLSGMIIVIREDSTERKELDNCVRQLKLSNVKILGCVMNGAKREKTSYGKYKKYYKYYKQD